MDADIDVSVFVRVRALGKPMHHEPDFFFFLKIVSPRNFSERPALESNKEVALTGHLGAAQVRRAQT